MASSDAAALPPSPSLPRPKRNNPMRDAIQVPYREEVRKFYNNKWTQYFVAVIILGNFLTIVVEKEIDPYDAAHQRHLGLWIGINKFCNWVFLIEILINFYGSCGKPFFRSGWNLFDLLVVIVGVIQIADAEESLGPFKQIKVLRAFRVMRLFKRVKSLNKILIALIRSLPGVFNAFAVMLIFMCIFAIMAVDFFRSFGKGGTYPTVQTYGDADAKWGQGEGMTFVAGSTYVTEENTSTIDSFTARGFHYGQEYFGTFFRALYTLFQVGRRTRRTTHSTHATHLPHTCSIAHTHHASDTARWLCLSLTGANG